MRESERVTVDSVEEEEEAKERKLGGGVLFVSNGQRNKKNKCKRGKGKMVVE